MKKHLNKKLIAFIAIALLLLISVGATMAFLVAQTDPVVNSFVPADVTCAVVEGNANPVEGALVNTGTIKENVQIKNTGSTDAYIRAAVVVNWMSADGTKVLAEKPVEGTDYTISYDLTKGWLKGTNGYYYFNKSVAPGEFTEILITNAIQKSNSPKGPDGTQYYLSIEIVGSAIQSRPATTVEKEWGVSVDSNGILSK